MRHPALDDPCTICDSTEIYVVVGFVPHLGDKRSSQGEPYCRSCWTELPEQMLYTSETAHLVVTLLTESERG